MDEGSGVSDIVFACRWNGISVMRIVIPKPTSYIFGVRYKWVCFSDLLAFQDRVFGNIFADHKHACILSFEGLKRGLR